MNALHIVNDVSSGYRSQAAPVVGVSPAWRDVLTRAARVAPMETTVCLQGESGTGKEVIARYIHSLSPRRSGPFVAINCAALPEHLLESELFGFERGAFTGAMQPKPGQIELASGGVLFLDEVTEMTPAAQAKFLRVLQEREFMRLGGMRPVQHQCAGGRRHQSRPARCGRSGAIPIRPVLPSQRLRRAHPGSARSPRRHPVAG